MKVFIPFVTLLSATSAHTIFQKIRINGAEQGQLMGVRAPSTNTPVMSVTGSSIACNTNLHQPVSQQVVKIPAGARVGAWFQHVIGGAQGGNDADNPIAASHKGPVMAYLAKVDNAGTAGTDGLRWFKVAEEGLNTGSGKWGVDTVLQNNGWWDFTMPSCLAPGQYMMRVELIALHSAYSAGQAQFYMSCANIEITGGGSTTPSNTVSFPGAYNTNDPGIQLNIYQGSVPNNGLKPYTIPGPRPMSC